MAEQRPSVGFYGLGAMGYPLAGHLAQAGFPIAVADPVQSSVDRWCAVHATAAHRPDRAEIVITCVTDERALQELLMGTDGLVAQARDGQLFIDHTTASPRCAGEIAAAAGVHGASFVDAPMSGAEAGAARGALSLFCGGSSEAIERARPLLACYAERITHLGPAGCGQLGKIANQIAIAGTVRGLAEAVVLARAGGLDIDALLEALRAGSASSKQLEQHRGRLGEADFQFARTFAWLRKDLALGLEEARSRGAGLPQSELVARLLDDAS